MSDATTQHTPADVRERVAKIVREAMEDARRSERLNTFLQSSMWDYTDRILAILRTPRGEGQAWCAFLDALDEFEAAANLWVDPEGPSAEDMARLDRARQRVIECARALAAVRSDAQGEDDLASLIVLMWTRCRNDGPHYRESDEFWAHFERAYRLAAARRGEGGGE